MQRMKRRVKQAVVVLVPMAVSIMLFVGISVDAQRSRRSVMSNRINQDKWRVFSPPDGSFTVELPREPRRTNNPDPEGLDEQSFLEWFECTQSVDFYVLKLRPTSPANAFIIGVFNVSGCQRRPEMFDEEVRGLVAIIGGDNKRLISDSVVRVNGLSGREVVYETGEKYGRVLIVNAGKRIYVLIYETNIAGETSSPETTRMFRTFRPARS